MHVPLLEYTAFSDEEFYGLGHDPEEMALFCSFHGEECDTSDFSYFRDTRYGNCVTFNSGRTSDGDSLNISNKTQVKKSSVAGPEFGKSISR